VIGVEVLPFLKPIAVGEARFPFLTIVFPFAQPLGDPTREELEVTAPPKEAKVEFGVNRRLLLESKEDEEEEGRRIEG